MRIPRIILNPSVTGWIRLLQRERKENARLRRELIEWQNTFRQSKGAAPLFTPPAKSVEPVRRPPIGMTDKKRYLAETPDLNHIPTAEEILAAAASRNGNK